MVKIIGIAGSLRKESLNKRALKAAQSLMPDGATLDIYEDLSEIPPFNQDQEGEPPEAVREFIKRIKESDAVLFATPEYNSSIPGILKNAIDWASRPYGDSSWDGKPVAIMGASPGTLGTVRAQNHLRQILIFLNMFPLNRPEVLVPNAQDKFDEHGNLTDEHTKDKIKQMLEALINWTVKLAGNDSA